MARMGPVIPEPRREPVRSRLEPRESCSATTDFDRSATSLFHSIFAYAIAVLPEPLILKEGLPIHRKSRCSPAISLDEQTRRKRRMTGKNWEIAPAVAPSWSGGRGAAISAADRLSNLPAQKG